MNRRRQEDSAEFQAARHITLTAYIEAVVLVVNAASGTATTFDPKQRQGHDLMMEELNDILRKVRGGATLEQLTQKDAIALVLAGAILAKMDEAIGVAIASKALGL